MLESPKLVKKYHTPKEHKLRPAHPVGVHFSRLWLAGRRLEGIPRRRRG